MKARISDRAKIDILDIHDYIAAGSKRYAKETLAKFTAKFMIIRSHPLSGTPCDELSKGLRSYPVGSYIIFYRVEDEIVIERIIHSSKDIDSIMGSN